MAIKSVLTATAFCMSIGTATATPLAYIQHSTPTLHFENAAVVIGGRRPIVRRAVVVRRPFVRRPAVVVRRRPHVIVR